MSLSYLAYNLGSGVGPLLAGYLFWNYTAWIYWGNGLAALIGIVVVYFNVRETGKNTETDKEETSELEQATNGSVWDVLKERPRLLFFGVLCTLLWFSLHQMTMTTPLYLSHIFGKEGAALFGQLMTFASIAVVILTPILMRLTAKRCELSSLAVSGGMFALGYGIVMLSAQIPIQFLAWLFLSAAEVLLLTKEGVYIANHSPSSHRGRINGVLVTIRNVGLMPTYILMGVCIQNLGYSSTWLIIIGTSSISALAFWLMFKQQKSTEAVNAVHLNSL